MAIYHLDVSTIGRSEGKSAVASAAWRSRCTLYDERLGKTHNYSRYEDLLFSEILIHENAPERFKDREILWNEVERSEKRKDSQLARVVEVAIPIELDLNQQINLVKEFAQHSFVDRGMIADIGMIANESNPHATIMLTTRTITENGFGQKNIEWNKKGLLFTWRKEWADIQNKKLEEADCDVRVDHRSHEERGIDLEPQKHVGYSAKYISRDEGFLKKTRGLDRLEEHQRIRRENGERITQEPARALKLFEQRSEVFKRRDIEKFSRYHSADPEQYTQVLQALLGSTDLLLVGKNEKGEELFSIRKLEAGKR